MEAQVLPVAEVTSTYLGGERVEAKVEVLKGVELAG
jgi:hypothetical protein